MSKVNELASLVDQFGTHFSRALRWPPIRGRMMALLMLSDRAMDLEELCDQLGASAGSASGNARELIRNGVIEKVKIAGSRRKAYRWRHDAWVGCAAHQHDILQPIQQAVVDSSSTSVPLEPFQRQRFQRASEYYDLMTTRMRALAQEVQSTFAEHGDYVRSELRD